MSNKVLWLGVILLLISLWYSLVENDEDKAWLFSGPVFFYLFVEGFFV